MQRKGGIFFPLSWMSWLSGTTKHSAIHRAHPSQEAQSRTQPLSCGTFFTQVSAGQGISVLGKLGSGFSPVKLQTSIIFHRKSAPLLCLVREFEQLKENVLARFVSCWCLRIRVFLPACSKVTEVSLDGFSSIHKPPCWQREPGNSKSSEYLCLLLHEHCPSLRDFDHSNLIKNILRYWTWRTFPCMLVCLRHANLHSILGSLIAPSAKEHVNRKSWSIISWISTFFLHVLVMQPGTLGVF